jgi:aldehyde dehydrogenase (NAD+)
MAAEPARTTTVSRYSDFGGQYIDGDWRPGGRGTTLKDVDPYSGATLAEIAMANEADLDAAYEAAARAQPEWAAALPDERAEVLRRAAAIMDARREEIVDWLVRESGGIRAKGENEWAIVRAFMLEAASYPSRVDGRIIPADAPGKESRVYRRPVGVIGVISPWNYPMQLSHRSVGPALALGNAVVVKPSGDTPVTGGLLIAKIYEEAGLPPGLLNVVIGASRDIGDAFTLHPIPRVISFTGSTGVGRHIGELAMRSSIIKRVALELGGNAPFVVLEDADVDQAVRAAVFGRFMHQGQICMSTNRIIVDAKVHDDFVDRFASHVKGLKHGNPNDPDTAIGPVINEKQLSAHLAHIEHARSAGARQIVGGEPEGLVLPPHVFVDVRNDMEIAQDEMFGPIAPIIKVGGEAEALRVANDTPFGLSSAVFTRDRERGVRFARGLDIGMTHVNDSSVDDLPNSPFGGEKNSGIGRFNGEWVIRDFTTDHWVTVQHGRPTYPF